MNPYPSSYAYPYPHLYYPDPFFTYLTNQNFLCSPGFARIYNPSTWNNQYLISSFPNELKTIYSLNHRQENNSSADQENKTITNLNNQEIDSIKSINNKNLDSNILKYFHIYLKDHFLYSGKLEKILKAKGISLTKKQFNQLVHKYVRPKKHYFNTKLMTKLWKGLNYPEEFSLLMRLALKQFLIKDFPLLIREVPRLSKQSKQNYLCSARKLHQKIQFKSTFYK